MPPKDFAINKEVPFLFLESAPFSQENSALEVSCPSKFEMLPTSLILSDFIKYLLIPLFFVECTKETTKSYQNKKSIQIHKVVFTGKGWFSYIAFHLC